MKGFLDIHDNSRADGSGLVYVTLTDDMSGTVFLQAQMKPLDFLRAITAHGRAPLTFELHPALIGKIAEHKQEVIWIRMAHGNASREEEDVALIGWEVDGWVAERQDFHNTHNLDKADPDNRRASFRVRFVRYVDPPAPETPHE